LAFALHPFGLEGEQSLSVPAWEVFRLSPCLNDGAISVSSFGLGAISWLSPRCANNLRTKDSLVALAEMIAGLLPKGRIAAESSA